MSIATLGVDDSLKAAAVDASKQFLPKFAQSPAALLGGRFGSRAPSAGSSNRRGAAGDDEIPA